MLFMQNPLEVRLPSFHLRRRALDSQRDCKTYSVYLVRHKARPSHRIGELSTKLALTEPVGGSSPKFTLKSSVSALKTLSGNPFELSCPAQGSPIPSFRSPPNTFFQTFRADWGLYSKVHIEKRWRKTRGVVWEPF